MNAAVMSRAVQLRAPQVHRHDDAHGEEAAR